MKSCIIADEAPVIRKVADRILDLNGFACEQIETSADLMRALRREMPDLLIIAQRLEDEDGLALVERIREMPGGNLPTILVCSSENGIALRTKSRRSGANGILMKPFTRETMEIQLGRLGLAKALAA